MTPPIDRRRFFGVAALTAAAAATGAGLAGCSNTTAKSAAKNAKVVLPAYKRFDAVEPDLAPTGAGVLPGYFSIPRDARSVFAKPPVNGTDRLRILVETFQPVPPSESRNAFWQAMEQKVGAKLDFELVTTADFPAKFGTVIAGGDIPDLCMFALDTPHRAEALKKLFADLTPHLSGSAVADYPYLANIPTDSWRPTVHNGGIYGIPTPRALVGQVLFVRTDLVKQRGLSTRPASFAEFRELCVGLTDKEHGRYALGNFSNIVNFLAQMTGAPNGWREQGGKLTNAIETDEMKQAVGAMQELARAGVFSPDTTEATFLQLRSWLEGGKIALHSDGYAGWDLLADAAIAQSPTAVIGGLIAGGYDGGPARQFAGPAAFSFTAVKKGSSSQVKQRLAFLNWLTAPFGTAEYTFRKYGVEGTDFSWQDGRPVLTDKGKAEVSLPLQYIADSPSILGPGDRTRIEAQHGYEQQVVPTLVRDPTAGLYSDTQLSKSSALSTIIGDAQTAIFAGRKPLSSWDDAVHKWRSSGGDQIRTEFQDALQKRG